MSCNVFITVNFLSKASIATFNTTWIRSLTCVSSQMIIEVVPFSKMHITANRITLKKCNLSFCYRISISKDSILVSLRNFFFDLHGRQIKCSSILHFNYYSFGNFRFKPVQVKLVPGNMLDYTIIVFFLDKIHNFWTRIR